MPGFSFLACFRFRFSSALVFFPLPASADICLSAAGFTSPSGFRHFSCRSFLAAAAVFSFSDFPACPAALWFGCAMPPSWEPLPLFFASSVFFTSSFASSAASPHPSHPQPLPPCRRFSAAFFLAWGTSSRRFVHPGSLLFSLCQLHYLVNELLFSVGSHALYPHHLGNIA